MILVLQSKKQKLVTVLLTVAEMELVHPMKPPQEFVLLTVAEMELVKVLKPALTVKQIAEYALPAETESAPQEMKIVQIAV